MRLVKSHERKYFHIPKPDMPSLWKGIWWIMNCLTIGGFFYLIPKPLPNGTNLFIGMYTVIFGIAGGIAFGIIGLSYFAKAFEGYFDE